MGSREGHTETLLLSEGRAARGAEDADSALVARAQRGERAAFDQLYLRHRDQVYTLCLNLCGNREEAQDLLQETFLRAYRALPRFRGRSLFATWLHRIAVNLCRDAARRQRREQNSSALPPVSLAAKPAAIDQVRAALVRLRPHHRVVLVLRYLQSLTYQEIAELLNWPLPRVKVTLHRAKRAFKEAYLQVDGSQP